MRASELPSLLFGKDDPRMDPFRAAAKRWQQVHNRVAANEARLESGDHSGMESAKRIRQFIKRRTSKTRRDKWLDQAWNVLEQSGENQVLKKAVTAGDKSKSKSPAADQPEIAVKPTDTGKPATAGFDTAPKITPVSHANKAAMLDAWLDKASDKEVRKLGEEALIGNNDTLDVEFFERGIKAAHSIGLIMVTGEPFGTGFFIAEGIILTNNHVVPNAAIAAMSQIIMNVEVNRVGPPLAQEEFALDPARFFYTNETLDFTVVATVSQSQRNTPVKDFGHLPLIRGQGKILKGQPTNVIHHMSGGNKVVSLREGVLLELPNRGNVSDFCYYSSDTDKGSSGSPVFNDTWEVVALHHHSLPKLDGQNRILDVDGNPIDADAVKANPALRNRIAWEANEGTRVSRICADLEQAVLPIPAMDAILRQLVATFPA